jgi:hypothetical protein
MSFDPSAHVDETVTVRGVAMTARAGAAVGLEDGTPLYVDGLEEWSEELEGSSVEVTGVLRLRGSQLPPVAPGGARVHGLGESFAVEDARWAPVG